jgi:hypothetical protein
VAEWLAVTASSINNCREDHKPDSHFCGDFAENHLNQAILDLLACLSGEKSEQYCKVSFLGLL